MASGWTETAANNAANVAAAAQGGDTGGGAAIARMAAAQGARDKEGAANLQKAQERKDKYEQQIEQRAKTEDEARAAMTVTQQLALESQQKFDKQQDYDKKTKELFDLGDEKKKVGPADDNEEEETEPENPPIPPYVAQPDSNGVNPDPNRTTGEQRPGAPGGPQGGLQPGQFTSQNTTDVSQAETGVVTPKPGTSNTAAEQAGQQGINPKDAGASNAADRPNYIHQSSNENVNKVVSNYPATQAVLMPYLEKASPEELAQVEDYLNKFPYAFSNMQQEINRGSPTSGGMGNNAITHRLSQKENAGINDILTLMEEYGTRN
jgi:hypothetical protein